MTTEKLGCITLVHGDCMDYMATLPDNAYDLAIVDPPYGAAAGEETGGGMAINHLAGGGWAAKYRKGGKMPTWDVAPGRDYFEELLRVSRNQIIWGANYFPGLPPTRCFVVWRKKQVSESFSMAMAEYAWTSFDCNAKVFEAASNGLPSDPRIHPTQKPVALYSWLLTTFAHPSDRILDTHGGSMSHAIAAHTLGFDLTIVEVDSEYYSRARERLINHQRQQLLTF